ncbi:hypothetical protein FA13DRAFT_1798344 [Coprinellus micaceus]|uniref:Uncharacterized protein n=1 Tax=Coprinellus micaceus TaxID=71717 RepID=A0A4Y7SMG2_COPMI|nr:hypothetical protein FA13DRAFT_1798344 [Coprinellus micaceus]
MPSRRKPASPNRRRQAASAPTTSNTTSGQAASPNATTPPKAAVAQHPTISSLKDAKDVKIDSFNATTFGGDNYEIVNKNTYASGANHTSHIATGHSTMHFGAIPASAPAAPSPAPPSEGGGRTLGVPPAQGLFAVPESSLGTTPQGTGDNDVG